MKEIIIGDTSVYSEDGDTWNDLIKVISKANKAYQKSITESQPKKRSIIKAILKKII